MSDDAADSWYHERESAWLYRVVAERVTAPAHKQLFVSLAEGAEHQAEHWAAKFTVGEFRPRLRARLAAWLVRRLGARATRSMLVAMKLRGLSVFDSDGADIGHAMPTSVGELGQRHRGVSSANNLRAAVFGINDGLVSNTCLILGVAGASIDAKYVLMSGSAGLLAGALSMASGEYVSVRSQREMYEYQIGLERAELAQYPEEEAEELALIYTARGVEQGAARALANRVMTDPERALRALAREELGLNPDDLASPWGAASWSFGAFALGALIPLLPFIAGWPVARALWGTLALAAASLFSVGMAISLFNGRSAWLGGLRMLLIGAVAAGCTWYLGRLLGVSVG